MTNYTIASTKPASIGFLDWTNVERMIAVRGVNCLKLRCTLHVQHTRSNLQSEAKQSNGNMSHSTILASLFWPTPPPNQTISPSPWHKQRSVKRLSGVHSLYAIRSEHFETKEKEHSEGDWSKMKRCVCVSVCGGGEGDLTSFPLSLLDGCNLTARERFYRTHLYIGRTNSSKETLLEEVPFNVPDHCRVWVHNWNRSWMKLVILTHSCHSAPLTPFKTTLIFTTFSELWRNNYLNATITIWSQRLSSQKAH